MMPDPDIRREIHDLASHYGVHVVGAVETGSRAKGYADEWSDHDVTCIVADHPFEYAAGTNQESLEREYEDLNIEFRMWDVTDFTDLISEGNPGSIEFLQSPVRYVDNQQFDALRDYVLREVSLANTYHAYRGIAKNCYFRYLKDSDRERTVKRNLVTARAVVAAEYIQQTQSIPPIDIGELLDEAEEEQVMSSGRLSQVRSLIERKRGGEGQERVGDIVTQEWLPRKRVDHDMLRERGQDDPQTMNEVLAAFVRSSVRDAESELQAEETNIENVA